MIDKRFDIENLYHNGPKIVVFISPSEAICNHYRSRGMVPPSVEVTAMIDTGASDTVIGPSIVEKLKLKTNKTRDVDTAAGTKEVDIHTVCITFKDFTAKFQIYPTCQPINEKNFQVLLGRDILLSGGLIYDGENNFFRLRL
jgi:predicted aspartyl protease